MKKRLIAVFAALLLSVSLLPTARAAGTYSDSGMRSLPKLSKQEIVELLNDEDQQLPDDVFSAVPSLEAPYAAGSLGQAAQEAALSRLNALRRIAGLSPVALNDEYTENAQHGAVLLAASNQFDHYPSRPSDMDDDFFQKAYDGTSHSNLAAGTNSTVVTAVDQLMEDTDTANITKLGHRRWQLYPGLAEVGFGYAFSAQSTYRNYIVEAFDTKVDRNIANRDFDFVAWPASGVFPCTLMEGITAWSVSVRCGRYNGTPAYQVPVKSDITVTLTRKSDGKTWTFDGGKDYGVTEKGDYFTVDSAAYGGLPGTIIFRPSGIDRYEGVYTVTITGLKKNDGSAATLSYQVEFFDPDSASAFEDVSMDDWFYEGVDYAVEHSLMNGTGTAAFAPGSAATRGMIMTILARQAGVDTAGSAPWYQKGMDWSVETGVSDGTEPGRNITREELVVMLYRLEDKPEADVSVLDSFRDASSVHDWEDFPQAMAWAVETGIITGSDDNLMPRDSASRAQTATILMRFCENVAK